MAKETWIVSAKRTPLGHFQGQFKNFSAVELGSKAILETCQSINIPPDFIEEVYMGCVLSAGLGQAPARQALLHAGLPEKIPATTINKVCGSGMQSVILAHRSILSGESHCVLAGGMESMTNTPYLLPKARAGYRFGHQRVLDHCLYDGLEDAYEKGQAMGVFAEKCAETYGLTREMQDQFAIESYQLALKASQNGWFQSEMIPIEEDKTQPLITQDEGVRRFKPDKIAHLKPAFKPQGTVTAGNASSLSDGAASLILMSPQFAEENHLTPIARIVATSHHAQNPSLFTTAPIHALEKLFAKTGWQAQEIDLYEINEAFAVVALAMINSLKLPREKVNIHGGACVLGHPIGCSGARILVTLIHALKTHGLKRGAATACIGGGEATAIALEAF